MDNEVKEKTDEETAKNYYAERINDASGFELDGLNSEEEKNKMVEELIKKTKETIERMNHTK